MRTNQSRAVRTRARLSGFTLVELLVVSAIVMLSMGAVAAAVSAGVAVWDTARNFDSHRIDALVWLETLEMELRSAPVFHGIETRCEAEALAFPSIPRASGLLTQSEAEEIRYSFDRDDQSVMRRVTGLPFSTRRIERDVVAVVSRVRTLEFEGEYLETEDAEGNKRRELTRVLVSLAIGEGEESVEIRRTIYLPVRQEKEPEGDEQS